MKKILLITNYLNGYEQEIIESLKKKSFKVTFFPRGSKINKKDMSVYHRLVRALVTDFHVGKLKNKLESLDKSKYLGYLDELESKYDYIFDFGGKIKPICLNLLKEKYNSEFILYMWDDLKYAKTVWKTMDNFDEKYIFNKKEAENYGFIYRPNFYVNKYLYRGEEKNIDIFYKGTLRDRKRTYILEAIENELKSYILDFSFYAKGSYWKNFKKVHSRKYFYKKCNSKFSTVEELALKYKSSKILLDISYKNQSGLGLRPLEAIAANCKLITTNKNIKGYEFYNENNIFCLEENLSNINEIKNFVNTPFEEYSDDIKYKYSVNGFVDDIFGVEK